LKVGGQGTSNMNIRCFAFGHSHVPCPGRSSDERGR
jgi:hypothetical protein